MNILHALSVPTRADEDAGAWIVLKIRWVGVILGYLVVNLTPGALNAPVLNGLLGFGLAFTLLDTWYRRQNRIFLVSIPALKKVTAMLLPLHYGGKL